MEITVPFKMNLTFNLEAEPDLKQHSWNKKEVLKEYLECILLEAVGIHFGAICETSASKFNKSQLGYKIAHVDMQTKSIMDILTS